MNPGPDLDRLIAEKLFGWAWYEFKGDKYLVPPGFEGPGWNDDNGNRPGFLTRLKRFPKLTPNYSTDISAAWKVVDKVRNKSIAFSIVTLWDQPTGKYLWLAKFEWWGTERFEFSAQDTAPHAICLAALKAVGHEIK